jgi:endoglucanase
MLQSTKSRIGIGSCLFAHLGIALATSFFAAACASSNGQELGACKAARPAGTLDPYAQAQRLGRGVNFGDELEATPNEGAWTSGLVIDESHFDLAKAAGFDSVRLPVGFAGHAQSAPPYTIDAPFMQRVDQVVSWGLARGLRVVVDLHNYGAIQTDPQGQRSRFVALWQQIATHFQCSADELYYELLNEPSQGLTPVVWNSIVADALAAIRAIDSRHTVIVGTTDWSNPDDLNGLEVPASETNAIVAFHYYTPTLFCFQGKSSFMGKNWATTGITWPGPPASPVTPTSGVDPWVASWIDSYNTIQDPDQNPASERVVEDDIAQAAAWGSANGRPLWMGEFTAQDGADLASRARWMAAARTHLEAHGIAWSVWTLATDPGSKLYDVATGQWTTELTQALGLEVHN